LGYLGYFENNSFISHISPKKVPTSEKLTEHNVQNEDSLSKKLKILHPICLKFAVIFLLFYTAAWSRQRPLSCWSWHGRNDFRLLINRTWKLLAKVFKWSPIVCLLLLTVMKNPEKYECGS
jgi:hypothetical protein